MPKTANYAHGGRGILLRALLGSPSGAEVLEDGGLGPQKRRKKGTRETGGWQQNEPSPNKWGGEGPRRGVAK